MGLYDIPHSLKNMFEIGDRFYNITDYSPDMEMDNNQSLAFLLDHIGANEENIIKNLGTQILLKHDDYKGKVILINSSGNGDFYSHTFEVSIYNKEDIEI